jgi:hypothetical protein
MGEIHKNSNCFRFLLNAMKDLKLAGRLVMFAASRLRKNSVQGVRAKSPGKSQSRYGVRPQAWREY